MKLTYELWDPPLSRQLTGSNLWATVTDLYQREEIVQEADISKDKYPQSRIIDSLDP